MVQSGTSEKTCGAGKWRVSSREAQDAAGEAGKGRTVGGVVHTLSSMGVFREEAEWHVQMGLCKDVPEEDKEGNNENRKEAMVEV